MSNVLLIFADDMRKDMLRFMPFVNGAFRAEATEFTNAFCNVPIYQASRVAILTGQHALNNGIYHNEEQSEWGSGYAQTIGSWAQIAGATTGAFGKMPNGYRQAVARPGWNTWKITTGGEQESISYAMSTDGAGGIELPLTHHLEYIKNKVSEFCVDTVGDWFAWWNPSSPHITTSTLRNNPLSSSYSKFDWVKWQFDLLTDAELAATTKPTWIAGRTVWTKSELAFMAEMARGQIKECYDLDKKIKDLCDDLIADGSYDDTTIIFCSDGGVFFGEQRTGNLFASGKKRAILSCR